MVDVASSAFGARLDHGRPSRTGEPEVVYGAGKTPAAVAQLLTELLERTTGPVLATRCTPAHAEAFGQGSYDEVSRLLVARAAPVDETLATTAVACAGVSDLPVAREATGTLAAFGMPCELISDIGVAGVHRVLEESGRLASAGVCIVVAGMEGALTSVVAGLVSAPIVAVPTSVGYGAAFEGLAALLGMLNACAPGIGVVNIDNGYGAGVLAARVARAAGSAR